MGRLTTAGLVLVLSCGPVGASPQNPQPRDVIVASPGVPMEFGPVDLSVAALPDGDEAWVVMAVTRGGLAGGGAATLVVDSRGRVTCANTTARCPQALEAAALKPLQRAVTSSASLPWTGSLSTCSDCFRTLLVLRQRLRDGTVAVHTAFWDATTQSNVAADVRNLYSAALAVAR